MAYNKFITKNGEVMLDLTNDSVTESNVAQGITFHKKDGTQATGTGTLGKGITNITTVRAQLGVLGRSNIEINLSNVTINATAEVE